jgi:hypothetical protein
MARRANAGTLNVTWNPQYKCYTFSGSYNKEYLDILKVSVPASGRSWNEQSKSWLVDEKYVDPLLAIARKVFGTVNYQTKAQFEAKFGGAQQSYQQSQQNYTISSPKNEFTPNEALEFIKLIPREALRKAYLQAAMLLHPDRNSDPEASTKMSKLNALWNRIEILIIQQGDTNGRQVEQTKSAGPV